MSRSGTIGPVAIFNGAEEPCVAGAYLMEFGLSDTISSEYIKGFFLSDYGQALLIGGSRWGAQANLNASTVKGIPIPIPPLDLQRRYERYIEATEEVVNAIKDNVGKLDDFYEKMTALAFIGDLSRTWRESNQKILERAASERNKAIEPSRKRVLVTEFVPEERPWPYRPKRRWMLNQLSEIQGFLYEALREWKGTLIPSEDLNQFRQQCFQIEHLKDANDHIRRALNQLAGLGLIAKISVPNQAGEYVTGYRGLRDDELTWANDIQRLKEE